MALHVNEMSIQFKVGDQKPETSADACAPDGDDASRRQQERMVDDTVRRVLAILKVMEGR